MGRFRLDPEALSRSFIVAVEKYDYDGILVDVDTATLAGALGARVDFPEDEPARVAGGCVDDVRRAEQLLAVDISSYPVIQTWLEAVQRLRSYFGNEILIRGNCDQCPFSLAALVRGMEAWMLDLLDPEMTPHITRMLDICHRASLEFVELMADAGAHVISNGDSTAGPAVISPKMYLTFAWPYEKRIVERTHQLGLPYVLHICGNTRKILGHMVQTGADGLEVDQETDASLARKVLRETTFFGNLDPSRTLARGTARQVRKETIALLEIFRDTPRFVLNSGCAIPADTPPENLRAMIRTAREFR